MNLPISKLLKKREQVETAELQDEIIMILYSVDLTLVLHGGTAIWRCYAGKRFSDDIDLYSIDFPEHINKFISEISGHNLILEKIKDTGNIIFSSISSSGTTVKIEINHTSLQTHKVERRYELVDGSSIDLLTLPAEYLILEKIYAYQDRKFIRDLYDIYHLLPYAENYSIIKNELTSFIENIEKPANESFLKTIVYSGIPPSFDRMVLEIKRKMKSVIKKV